MVVWEGSHLDIAIQSMLPPCGVWWSGLCLKLRKKSPLQNPYHIFHCQLFMVTWNIVSIFFFLPICLVRGVMSEYRESHLCPGSVLTCAIFCCFQNMYTSLIPLSSPKICWSKGLYMYIFKIFLGYCIYTQSLRTTASHKMAHREKYT